MFRNHWLSAHYENISNEKKRDACLKKYELLTNDTKILSNGVVLYRVRYLKDFELYSGDWVKKGSLGGYLESEFNLLQEGKCAVLENAMVFDKAQITQHACIFGNAKVFGKAFIGGGAKIYGNASVYGESKVFGYSKVYWCADISGKAIVSNNCEIFGKYFLAKKAIFIIQNSLENRIISFSPYIMRLVMLVKINKGRKSEIFKVFLIGNFNENYKRHN